MNVKSGITIVASSAFVPTKARNCGSRRCRKPQFLLVGVVPQTVSKDNSLGSPQPPTFMLTQKISGIAGGATPSRAKK